MKAGTLVLQSTSIIGHHRRAVRQQHGTRWTAPWSAPAPRSACSLTGDITTQEWFTFEGGSTVDFAPQNANRTVTMDGVIGVAAGTTTFTYSGANAGSSTVALNTNAGYLFGSGVIAKGTVNNGPAGGVFGGTLVINESNPLFRGGFNIDGGSLIIKSVGNPTGTGAGGSADQPRHRRRSTT